MLVLSRKIGERIVIAGDIVVTVVGQQGDRVKLGFEAPPHVVIHRQEVLAKLQAEEHAAQAKNLASEALGRRVAAAPELALVSLPAYVI